MGRGVRAVTTADEIGACGDWCGKCYHFGHDCTGCSSKASECKFLKCLAQKNLEHCGLCAEFPCDDLADFVPDDRLPRGFHVESLRFRARFGKDAWVARYRQEWQHLVERR